MIARYLHENLQDTAFENKTKGKGHLAVTVRTNPRSALLDQATFLEEILCAFESTYQ
jgi:hypothetical protein